MPWWTLVALGAFAAVFALTALVAVIVAARIVRAVRSARMLLLGASTPLVEGLDVLQTGLEGLGTRRAQLESTLAALERSRRRLDVLVWALADIRGFASRARRSVPRK
jgi:hypothetical protein